MSDDQIDPASLKEACQARADFHRYVDLRIHEPFGSARAKAYSDLAIEALNRAAMLMQKADPKLDKAMQEAEAGLEAARSASPPNPSETLNAGSRVFEVAREIDLALEANCSPVSQSATKRYAINHSHISPRSLKLLS